MRRVLVSALLMASVRAMATPAATFAKPAIDLPVHEVTVFSDRARVVRAGSAKLARGVSEVMLPSLPATIDPASVRLDAKGAKVVHVTVERANQGELPEGDAQAIIDKLEKLTDELVALQDGLREKNGERTFLAGITPAATPGGDQTHPPLLLEPGGWTDALGFFDAREDADDAALSDLTVKLTAKKKEVEQAAAEARRLAGMGAGSPGYKVRAVLDASATSASLSLAYFALGARWYPTYDVRYDPAKASVSVSFGALVSQQTGEDWNDANLLLSTAIPQSTATLPKLLVWKIGEKDRFIPTPQPAWQPPMSPPAPPVPWATRPRNEQAGLELRQALYAAANAAEAGERNQAEAVEQAAVERERARDERAVVGDLAAARATPDLSLDLPEAAPPPPAPPRPEMMEARAPLAGPTDGMVMMALEGGYSRRPSVPTQAIGFGAPRPWQPPYYADDLPARLANGYVFVYRAAKPETVRTGGEAHQVALFTKTFSAEATVRILPALSKAAYLVAELRNDGDRPMLKGRAHLFVGKDLVGDAVVPTTAVGQTVTLPLGVDEAIKIERNVHVLSSEKGFFSKDDVSAYEVVIEVVNPRSKTVHALVEDQVPVAHGEHLEVKTLGVDPAATVDQVNGLVDWKVELKPGEKQTFTLRYSITRPKDWKLSQSTAPTGTNP